MRRILMYYFSFVSIAHRNMNERWSILFQMNEVPSLGVADEKESGDGEFKKPTLSKKREHAKESDGPDTKKPAGVRFPCH